jgi:hypothetical protein
MLEQVLLVAKIAGYVRKGQQLDTALERLLSQTEKFTRKREQLDIEWWAELVHAIRRIEGRLNQLEQAEVKRRFLENHEGIGILANYVDEAYSEPLDERRRMLAHAAAGLANLELSIAELARAQRILRELDPDDAVALYQLHMLPHSLGHSAYERFSVRTPGQASAVIALKLWEQGGRESLSTSGCVRILAAGGGFGVGTHEELRLTDTGRLVLKVLHSYLLVRQPDLTGVPGHEVTEHFRSEEKARTLIASVPRLHEILLESVARNRSYCQYEGCRVADGAPANGRATLRLHLRRAEDGEHLSRVTTREQANPGEPVQSIYVDTIDHRPADEVEHYLHLAGPHDVIRWLAYDLGATWV